MLSGASRFGNAFISYGSYHYNSVYWTGLHSNKIIHIVCVPILTVTLFAMLGYLPGSISISGFKIGFAELFYVLTMAYYFYIHSLFGVNLYSHRLQW